MVQLPLLRKTSPGRSKFPSLIAIVSSPSWNISSRSTANISPDPSSNADFETIIEGHRIPDIDEGHECYPIPNPSADVEAGANATLQIRYTSEFDTNENETYYACADIVYVPTSQFTYQVPCFNATVDDFEIVETNGTASASGSAAGASSTGEAPSTSKSSSSGLSGGAIAGIVVGVVVGLIAVVGGLFFMWRHTQQKKRLRQQEASLRTVKWDEHSHGGSASQTSDRDIALGNLR